MERKPLSTSTYIGAVVLLIVVPIALYVGGYFALGKYRRASLNGMVSRDYASDWQVRFYQPLVRLEGAVNGKEVWLFGPTIAYSSDGEVFMITNDLYIPL